MKYKLMMIFLLIVFGACNNRSPEIDSEDEYVHRDSVESLKKQNIALKKNAEKKDESLKQFMQAFNDINTNLQIIKQKEDIISMSAGEMAHDVIDSEQIKKDIRLIYRLLQENRKTVERLRADLESANMINSEMEQSLNILSSTVDRRDLELRKLRNKLESRNSEMQRLYHQMDSLVSLNKKRNETIREQRDLLNTAYIAVGTSRELFEKGVTSRSGGIGGMGAVDQFDSHFEQNAFEPLKIDQTRKIELNAKSARLLSTHPSTAYKFDGPDRRIDNLIITRPEKFWSTSRYLVIEVSY